MPRATWWPGGVVPSSSAVRMRQPRARPPVRCAAPRRGAPAGDVACAYARAWRRLKSCSRSVVGVFQWQTSTVASVPCCAWR